MLSVFKIWSFLLSAVLRFSGYFATFMGGSFVPPFFFLPLDNHSMGHARQCFLADADPSMPDEF